MPNAHLSLPPLASLRAFQAVARSGSVKLASESLNLTPSAISHQIRTLETHFGVQLVRRSGRGVALTESGAVYGAGVLSAFNELIRVGNLLDHRKKGHIVRLSVTPTFAMLAALPHLERFRVDNPGLNLRLEAENTLVDFERNNIDAAVQLGEPPFNGLTFHRLFTSRMVPCANQKLWDQFSPIHDPRDLAKMPLIQFNTAPDSWQKWFSKMAPELASKEPDLGSDGLLTGMQMARSAMGVILAPFPLPSPMVTGGALSVTKLWSSQRIGLRDYYFTYRKVDASSEKIRSVHKWLKLCGKEFEAEA